jgi:hypothetical protein
MADVEAGILTITVPSCPRRPRAATVSVVMTEPEYGDVIVVYCGFGDGAEELADAGTLTMTVPSCPREPGSAAVSVVMADPV